MDGGLKRKKPVTRRLRIVIKRDKLGRYITIKGKKYRVGPGASHVKIAKFVKEKIKDPGYRYIEQGQVFPLRKETSEVDDLFNKQRSETSKREQEAAVNLIKADDLTKTKAIVERVKNDEKTSEMSARYENLTQLLRSTVADIWPLVKKVHDKSGDTTSLSKLRKLRKSELAEYILSKNNNKIPSPPISPRVPSGKDVVDDEVPSRKDVVDDDEDDEEDNKPLGKPANKLTAKDRRNMGLDILPLKRQKTDEENDQDDVINLIKSYEVPPGHRAYYSEAELRKLNPQQLLRAHEDVIQNYVTDVVKNGEGMGSKGMSNFQIDDILNKYPDYLGCISHDEILSKILPKIKPKSKGGFVINTDNHNQPGSHWESVYFDATPGGDKSIDFFDSYGDDIDPVIQKDLLKIADKLNAGTYLKLKTNRIRYQNSKSSNCGPFSVKFLIDRFRGKTFKDASGWNDDIKGEKDIEKFKKQEHIGFGFPYVASFGEGIFRENYPPSVRKYLTDTPITSIKVCRKPIQSALNTVLNAVTLGGWNKAKSAVGIDKALHLYMVINGNTILERNHIVSMHPGSGDSGAECMNVSLKGPLTFKELLENTSSKIGPSLQRYDARTNNCQVFLNQVLNSNGILTPELHKFINQDIQGVFEHLPGFIEKVAKTVTDSAHAVDVIVNGQRKRKRKTKI